MGLDFNVYPNPFSHYTTISITNPKYETYDLYLYDLKGTLIKAYVNKLDQYITLENDFSAGFYYLELISDNHNKRKIVIVK